MDEFFLYDRNLADIMFLHLSDIQSDLNNYQIPVMTFKPDGSPVTELDLALSERIEKISSQKFADCCFYSEEKFDEWKFPLLALDPLDGTKEYIEQRPEWAISIGIFENENFEGEGWVANPVTNEVFSMKNVISFSPKSVMRGEASRSEFSQGLYRNFSPGKFELTPRGSIAYKLGKLSQGKIDFVISMTPKNIWDIAGGSLLCKKAGLEFYSKGVKVTKVEKFYEPPLLWCHPTLFPELSQLFSS